MGRPRVEARDPVLIRNPIGLIEKLDSRFQLFHCLQCGQGQLTHLSVLNLAHGPHGGGQKGARLTGVLQPIGQANPL